MNMARNLTNTAVLPVGYVLGIRVYRGPEPRITLRSIRATLLGYTNGLYEMGKQNGFISTQSGGRRDVFLHRYLAKPEILGVGGLG